MIQFRNNAISYHSVLLYLLCFMLLRVKIRVKLYGGYIMERHITDERTGIKYALVCDYYFPELSGTQDEQYPPPCGEDRVSGGHLYQSS